MGDSYLIPLCVNINDLKYTVCCLNGLPWWLSSKEFTCNAGDVGSIPGQENSLEKEMAMYSGILA